MKIATTALTSLALVASADAFWREPNIEELVNGGGAPAGDGGFYRGLHEDSHERSGESAAAEKEDQATAADKKEHGNLRKLQHGQGYWATQGKGYYAPQGKGYYAAGSSGIKSSKGSPKGRKSYPSVRVSGSGSVSGKGYAPSASVQSYGSVASGKGYVSGSGSVSGKGYASSASAHSYGSVASGKGYVPSAEECIIKHIYIYKADLQEKYTTNSVGGQFDTIPFYDATNNERLGVYTDSAINLKSGDCVGSGVFSFGSEPDYDTQITVGFTCRGQFNAITGGTGTYGCASGYEVYTKETEHFVDSELYICGKLCPQPFTY